MGLRFPARLRSQAALTPGEGLEAGACVIHPLGSIIGLLGDILIFLTPAAISDSRLSTVTSCASTEHPRISRDGVHLSLRGCLCCWSVGWGKAAG